MSCKCSYRTDEFHDWGCIITGGECMFLLSGMFLICVEGFHGLAGVCVHGIQFMRNPFLRLSFRR